MKRSLSLLGVAAFAVLLATSAFAENRGVSFTPIGFHPQPGPNPASGVTGMNPEGTVFLVNPAAFGNYCIEWTRENGWGTQVGESTSNCRLSSGGVVMGTGRRYGQPPNEPTPPRPPEYVFGWPGTWTGVENEWSYLNPPSSYVPCGSSRLSFFDMGGEGDYATGLSWVTGCQGRAFLWEKATNTSIDLGSPNNRSTRGNAVTADGSSVIGWATMAQGLRRAGRWDNGVFQYFGDPNGEEPKECAGSGLACTSNSGSANGGCPGEYVDDGSCQNRGTCDGRGTCQNRGVCTQNVCVGGTNPGVSCTSSSTCRGACAGGTNDGTTCNSDSVCAGACTGGTNPGTMCTSASACAGTCVGPNAGANCTSDGACPDTLVCLNNPNWNASLFRGEAYDVTDDGQHAIGRQICYPDGSAACPFPTVANSGWISNPDGTFTAIPPPETFPELLDPLRVSQNAETVVGQVGSFFSGIKPFFWNRGMGTQDIQQFLLAQGLDELFFWNLLSASDVSADGKVIGGRGINPDGRIEGFIIDISKVWICHTPPGQPENARTLGVNSDNAASHLDHGDFLGTCEFLSSGGLSRAAELRERLGKDFSASMDPNQFANTRSSWDGPASPAPRPVAGQGARPKVSRIGE